MTSQFKTEHQVCDEHLSKNGYQNVESLDRNISQPFFRFQKRARLHKGSKPDINVLKDYLKPIELHGEVQEQWHSYSFGLAHTISAGDFVDDLLGMIWKQEADKWTEDKTFVMETDSYNKKYATFRIHIHGVTVSVNCYHITSALHPKFQLCVYTGSCLTGNDFQILVTNDSLIIEEQRLKSNYIKKHLQGFWYQMPLCSFHFTGGSLYFHGFKWDKFPLPKHLDMSSKVHDNIFQCNHAFFYFTILTQSIIAQVSEIFFNSHYTAEFKLAFSEGVHVSNVLIDSKPFCQMFGFSSHIFFYRKFLYKKQVDKYINYHQPKHWVESKYWFKPLNGNDLKHGDPLNGNDLKHGDPLNGNDLKHGDYFEQVSVRFKNNHLCVSGSEIGDICSSFFSSVLKKDFSVHLDFERGSETRDTLKQILAKCSEKIKNGEGKFVEERTTSAKFWTNLEKKSNVNADYTSNRTKTKILNLLRFHKHLPSENRLFQISESDLEVLRVDNSDYFVTVTMPFVFAASDHRGACSALFLADTAKRKNKAFGPNTKKNIKMFSQYHAAAEYWGALDEFNKRWKNKGSRRVFFIPQSCVEHAMGNFVYNFPCFEISYKICQKNMGLGKPVYYNHIFCLDLSQTGEPKQGFLSTLNDFTKLKLTENLLVSSEDVVENRNTTCQLLDQIPLINGYTMYRLHVWDGTAKEMKVMFYICGNYFNQLTDNSNKLTSRFIKPHHRYNLIE